MNFLEIVAQGDIEEFSETVSQTLENWSRLNPVQVLQGIGRSLLDFAPKLLYALIILAAGFFVIRFCLRFVKNILGRSKIDQTLHYFIRTTIHISLYTILIITCLGVLGVPLTPLITALGAIGLALSLSVQDSLSNIAGGISILFTRPFSKGNFVQIGDVTGTVKQIGLVYTQVSSIDNKDVFLPNGDVAQATITNFSTVSSRRLDLTFSVRGDCDIAAARRIVEDVVHATTMVLTEPEPIVRVSGQTYLLVHIASLTWVKASDYAALNAYLIETVRTDFKKAGILPGYPDSN